MADETITTTRIAAHGASRLPWLEIDSFNLELKHEEGFLGDRASKAAFRETLEEWRKPRQGQALPGSGSRHKLTQTEQLKDHIVNKGRG
jgi:hypothetical protein